VLGDELLYEIDMASREVSFWRIQWREDLLEPIPSIQVSRDERKSWSEDRWQQPFASDLADDSLPFDPWLGSLGIQATPSQTSRSTITPAGSSLAMSAPS